LIYISSSLWAFDKEDEEDEDEDADEDKDNEDDVDPLDDDVDRLDDDDVGVVNDKVLDDDDEDAADADAVDNDDDDDDDDNIVDAVVDVVTGVMLDAFRFLFLRVLRPPSPPLSFATKRILTATPFVSIW
jgi:hypothetical protein